MKVIFLDIDGVLNSKAAMVAADAAGTSTWDFIDPVAMAILNNLIERSGAELVVSSTWRMSGHDWVVERLLGAGITKEPIACTPKLNKERGHEIQAWLDAALNAGLMVESFVILDDDSDMVHLSDRLVQTSWETGILPEHVEAALKMLERSLKA